MWCFRLPPVTTPRPPRWLPRPRGKSISGVPWRELRGSRDASARAAGKSPGNPVRGCSPFENVPPSGRTLRPPQWPYSQPHATNGKGAICQVADFHPSERARHTVSRCFPPHLSDRHHGGDTLKHAKRLLRIGTAVLTRVSYTRESFLHCPLSRNLPYYRRKPTDDHRHPFDPPNWWLPWVRRTWSSVTPPGMTPARRRRIARPRPSGAPRTGRARPADRRPCRAHPIRPPSGAVANRGPTESDRGESAFAR
ncbi:hypothetical protein J2S43_008318 [Catenuloplanes nepalensis]|uniref:Uncharacterized protein n=1 Tax=Catenuloplanes nepalensis TaxID=587533 RepID=A0ABT9N996_9ACTN|nr:hypothetical protein [Catenuloplanes nepalensis]